MPIKPQKVSALEQLHGVHIDVKQDRDLLFWYDGTESPGVWKTTGGGGANGDVLTYVIDANGQGSWQPEVPATSAPLASRASPRLLPRWRKFWGRVRARRPPSARTTGARPGRGGTSLAKLGCSGRGGSLNHQGIEPVFEVAAVKKDAPIRQLAPLRRNAAAHPPLHGGRRGAGHFGQLGH